LPRDVTLDNQLRSHTVYDGEGQRAVVLRRMSGEEETAYLSQELTIRDGEFFSKHVFAGATRLASKVDSDWANDPSTLYFHPDHLGTTQYSSNEAQDLSQHDEYFPSGEVWHQETDPHYQQIRQFVFSGKELDQATGLMYFGARYYDGRQSQWLSPDPILSKQFSGGRSGGILIPRNLSAYTYAFNNPVKLVDPDGRTPAAACALVWVPGAGQAVCLGGLILTGAIILTAAVAGVVAYQQLPDRTAPPVEAARRNEPKPAPAPAPEPAPKPGPGKTVDLAPPEPKREKETFAIRVQAQGGGLEKSVPIPDQPTPVTAAQALQALDQLEAQLSKTELKVRNQALEKARNFVRNAATAGGLSAPGKNFPFTNKGVKGKDARIDIEIQRGSVNLVPPE
jgi:RHS repeat-associated protein